MDSEPLDVAELTRRVRILEGALGIDLDSTDACSGDPENCDADPCSTDRCPLFNNTPQQMARTLGKVSKDLTLLTHLVEVLQGAGVIKPEMLRKAALLARLAEVQEDLRQSDEALLTVASGGIVQQTLGAGAEALKQEQARLRRELEELSK